MIPGLLHGMVDEMWCLCVVAERPKRYMPFAEGSRSCIGKNLANATLPLTMAILLSQFSFKLADRVHQLTLSLFTNSLAHC